MNVLFALDAVSGKKIWSFDPKVPEAWVPYTAACRGVAYYQVPGADSHMECAERIIEGTLDMRLIAVDAATGRPCPGFGTNGEADLKLGLGQKDSETGKATDVIPGVAIDVNSGKPRWVFQMAHADVWDYDVGSQPSLIEYPTASGSVPALLVPTKQGDIYILDRATGKPLHPVEERPVPQGGAELDQRSRTQPFSGFHTLRQPDLAEKDMWGLSPIDQMICRINFRRARYEGPYTPPEIGRANIEWPGYNGGSDWGSVAIDSRRGIVIANYNNTANYNMLVGRSEADKLGLFPAGDPRAAGNASSAEGAGAMTGTPVAILVNAGWQMPTGLLCTQPPYGGIRAINLVTGKTIWDRPLGTARRNGPFGIPSMLPLEIGTPNNGGSVTTASGLVFAAAATDDLIRAIDIRTGKTV